MRHVWIVSYYNDRDGNTHTHVYGTQARARAAINRAGYIGGPTLFRPTNDVVRELDYFDRVIVDRKPVH